jgi:ubiquinone/menaquinone biosynthesis C-methylase UbiE
MKKQIIPNLDKLNLGCGTDIKEGYLNVDFENFKGVDLFYDLNKLPYPFADNQFSEIIMQDILEHLDNPYGTMKEIFRILKPGGTVNIRGPHFSCKDVSGDIQHKRGFNSETFKNKNLSGMFKIISQEITFPPSRFFLRPIVRLNPIFYEKHFAYILPAMSLYVELKAIK